MHWCDRLAARARYRFEDHGFPPGVDENDIVASIVMDLFLGQLNPKPHVNDANFEAWLNRVVDNRCRDALRRGSHVATLTAAMIEARSVNGFAGGGKRMPRGRSFALACTMP
jgi:DNA-directed RNA polymerase specialized sigma24 family protein